VRLDPFCGSRYRVDSALQIPEWFRRAEVVHDFLGTVSDSQGHTDRWEIGHASCRAVRILDLTVRIPQLEEADRLEIVDERAHDRWIDVSALPSHGGIQAATRQAKECAANSIPTTVNSRARMTWTMH